MRRLLRLLLGAVFWIAVVQAVWAVTLVLWIVYFAQLRERVPGASWSTLVWGILLLVTELAGITIVVVHFARQVTRTRAMREFLSGVSHDLRSPLATARLHIETVQLRGLDAASARACLETALHELDRLEVGIEDVLTAAKSAQGGLTVACEPVELRGLLCEYAARKRDDVEDAGGTLCWGDLGAGPTRVLADPELLHRLLDNLVDNAIAHCHRGVRVGLGLVEQGRCAVVAVRDDGPGLSARECRRVFKMFHRASGTRRRGTGIGLAIVDAIARAHGGRTWVESAGAGRGCTFRVALPLAPAGPS